jgi:hypothetical protein
LQAAKMMTRTVRKLKRKAFQHNFTVQCEMKLGSIARKKNLRMNFKKCKQTIISENRKKLKGTSLGTFYTMLQWSTIRKTSFLRHNIYVK